MSVGVVGSGPAIEAVLAALEDVQTTVSRIDATDVASVDLVVVAGHSGSESFMRVDRAARETDTAWIAIERGGVGGYPVVDAAVSGFDSATACYQCLERRVGANTDTAQSVEDEPAPEIARFAGAVAGREAVQFVTGRDPTIFGQVIEVPHTVRRLLPVPGCECGSDPSAALDRSAVDRSVAASLERAEQAVDDRVGIVSDVGEVESYPLVYYLAESAATDGFSDGSATRQAAGVADDWNAALMKALGEAFERYCAGIYRTAEFQRARPAERPDAVAPTSFVLPDDAATAQQSIPWVEGYRLDTDERVSLPAEFVHYPPPERQYPPHTTTGLGLGNSTVEALLAGLYEVIERDATMLSWYSTYDPLELTVRDDRYRTLVARAESEGLTVTSLLVTQDVDVPVVATAVSRPDGDWPQFALGSSAHFDASAAARSALMEALQNWLELRRMGRQQSREAAGAIGEFSDFPRAAQSVIDTAGTVAAASVGPSAVPSGEAELDLLLERLDDVGLTAYAARLTTRDVATLGFEAVRVLVPAAQPLFFDTPYFGDRAASVPTDLGFRPRLDRRHHPFP